MAKEFKDFTFMGKKLSDLSVKYVSVDFDGDADVNMAMERDMEAGDANRYKVEPNYFYDKWNDTLEFELDIIKDPCTYLNQSDSIITKSERREITKWLTSSHFPEWLTFSGTGDSADDTIRYFGWFNNIESYSVNAQTFGLKLYFKCTTPFGYTDNLVTSVSCTTYKNILIANNSDELNSYVYPSIDIIPKANGEIYICNMSDATINQTGTLSSSNTNYQSQLVSLVNTYAKSNACTVEFTISDSTKDIDWHCNNTLANFKLVDAYGNETYHTIFYRTDSKVYYIIENGLMRMSVSKDLKVYLDCQKLTINDELGRMVTYDKLGITDVAYMYWLQLLNGNNSLLFYGNCDFKVKHIESRKVGE